MSSSSTSQDQAMIIDSKALEERVPRRKRTLRLPFVPSSPSEQGNDVQREEFHARLGGVILGSPQPPEPTRNSKRQHSPPSLSVQRQQEQPRPKPPLRRRERIEQRKRQRLLQEQEQQQQEQQEQEQQEQQQQQQQQEQEEEEQQEQQQQEEQQQLRVVLRLAIRARDPNPAPEWLLPWMARKNGTNPRKVTEKTLTSTDVKAHQNRLSIPLSKIVDITFLRPEERIILEREAVEGGKIEGQNVKLMVSEEREFALNLRIWTMGSTSTYNLVAGWKAVVKACGLRSGFQIELWSFRADDKVYLAFVPPANLNQRRR